MKELQSYIKLTSSNLSDAAVKYFSQGKPGQNLIILEIYTFSDKLVLKRQKLAFFSVETNVDIDWLQF